MFKAVYAKIMPAVTAKQSAAGFAFLFFFVKLKCSVSENADIFFPCADG